MKQSWDISYIKKPKQLPNGKWSVYGVLPHRDENGKRKRVRKEGFGSKAEAEAWREEQQQKGRRYQMGGNKRWTRLDDLEEADAINAIKMLETKFPNKDRNLTDAVMNYITTYTGITSPKIEEAIERWLANPKMLSTTDAHQYQSKRYLLHFQKEFGNLPLDQFTEDHVEDFVFNQKKAWSKSSQLIVLRIINSFFNWCMKKKMLVTNPCISVDRPIIARKEPVSLTIPEIKTLMTCAKKVDGGSMIPYFALALFSAMRPAEILRLDWSDFNWDDREPCVSVNGKGNRRRSVNLHPTCIAWLEPYIKLEGPVAPNNASPYLFDLVRYRAGWRILRQMEQRKSFKMSEAKNRPKWPHDVMRHTGITYYYMLTHDKPLTASWAGNSPGIIDRHYRAVRGVTQGSCEEFWNILPDNEGDDSKGVGDLVA